MRRLGCAARRRGCTHKCRLAEIESNGIVIENPFSQKRRVARLAFSATRALAPIAPRGRIAPGGAALAPANDSVQNTGAAMRAHQAKRSVIVQGLVEISCSNRRGQVGIHAAPVSLACSSHACFEAKALSDCHSDCDLLGRSRAPKLPSDGLSATTSKPRSMRLLTYADLGSSYFDRLHADGLKRYLVKRLESLGHSVILQSRTA